MEKYCLTLENDFIEYCKINGINNVEGFAEEVFKKAFNIIKYGDKPNNTKIKKSNIITEPIKNNNTNNNNDLYHE